MPSSSAYQMMLHHLIQYKVITIHKPVAYTCTFALEPFETLIDFNKID